MKILTSILLTLFLSFIYSPSWSQNLTINDLIERGGLYYKKFSDITFTGKVSGIEKGNLKKGKGLVSGRHIIVMVN